MPGGFTFGQDNINEPSQYAPRSLIVKFIDNTSYEQAKELLERIGCTIEKKTNLWDSNFRTIALAPSDDLERCITQLRNEEIVRRVEKLILSHLAVT